MVNRTQQLRDRLLPLLGRFPDACAPDVDVEEMRQLDGYRRLVISYTVEPGERVRAYLLLPDAIEQRPAILAIHQHAGQYYLGKSETAGLSASADMHVGAQLCRHGYVVLCPDHLCFEDRRPPEYQRVEQRSLQNAEYERFEFTARLLHGSTLQAKYLSDLARAIDVLAERPDVDAERIGVIGHSLGGQEAVWLAWYDPRVHAAVCSCGVSTFQTILRDHVNHNYAAYVPGMLAVGDVDALVADVAPTPLLMSAGDSDSIFPIDGVRAIGQRASAAYADAGVRDRFRLIIFSGGHSFPAAVRAEAYAFLDHWLDPDTPRA